MLAHSSFGQLRQFSIPGIQSELSYTAAANALALILELQ
jgi:hypothetical protein